jgi:hypothetical protein
MLMPEDGNGGSRSHVTAGLSKEDVRRIVLDRLRTVYQEWGVDSGPFDDMVPSAGERREDPRAFVIALLAGVVGGLSEAMERNNAALLEAWQRRAPGSS